MKRAFFAMITVLLALVIVTCDLFPPVEKGDKDKPEIVYDENGEPWGVNLTISDKDVNRAMTGDIAKFMVNYYEVAFIKSPGGTIYRARWRMGETGRLAVPFGDYASVDPTAAPAAIMFAGRHDTKTLLAVGELTLVNGSTGTEITSTTTGVTFTLTPLTTDVHASDVSSFQITVGPANLTSYYDGTSGKEFPTVEYNNEDVPLFFVRADALNEATYTIGGGSGFPHSAGVFVQTPTLTADTVTSSSGPGFKPTTSISNGGAVMDSSGVFTFGLSVSDTTLGNPTKGLSCLFIDIPVRAMDQSDTSGDLWHIYGGIKNIDFDLGATKQSLGGAIMLATDNITDVSGLVIIEIGGSIP